MLKQNYASAKVTQTDTALAGGQDTVQYFYDNNGNLIETLYSNSDGSSVADYWDPAHGEQMYKQVVKNTDGTSYEKDINVTGTGAVNYSQTNYDANGGKIEFYQLNKDGSSIDDRYSAQYDYKLQQYNVVNADGSQVQTYYNVTGTGNAKDTVTYIDASGNTTRVEYNNNDGSSITDIYNTSHQLVQQIGVNADKSHYVTNYNVNGTGPIEYNQINYDASGKKIEYFVKNKDGSSTDSRYSARYGYQLQQYNVVNADGSQVQTYYNVTGSGNAKDTVTYIDANGNTTKVIYANNDGSSITDLYNTSHQLTEQIGVNADKSHYVVDYNVSGTGIINYTQTNYDASSNRIEFYQLNKDGSSIDDRYDAAHGYKLEQQNKVAANGSQTQETYDTVGGSWKDIIKYIDAAGHTTSIRYDNNDKSFVTDFYNANGMMTEQKNGNADGSSSITVFNYAKSVAWASEETFYDASGNKIEYQVINKDGSSTDTRYDPTHGDGISQYNVFAADHSSVQTTYDLDTTQSWKDIIKDYNSSNQLTEAEYDNRDGSGVIDYYDPVTGQLIKQVFIPPTGGSSSASAAQKTSTTANNQHDQLVQAGATFGTEPSTGVTSTATVMHPNHEIILAGSHG